MSDYGNTFISVLSRQGDKMHQSLSAFKEKIFPTVVFDMMN